MTTTKKQNPYPLRIGNREEMLKKIAKDYDVSLHKLLVIMINSIPTEKIHTLLQNRRDY